MRKGVLKEDYRLMLVDSKSWKDVTPEGVLELPELLSFSEFNSGQIGFVLFSIPKQTFVFWAEKFYKLFKKEG